MIISIKYKVFEGKRVLYAFGERTAIIEACHRTFSRLGWSGKTDGVNTLVSYPSGWTDRLSSAYASFSLWGDTPRADRVSLAWEATPSPDVTRVIVEIYLKKRFLNEKRQRQRFETFYESFIAEFTRLGLVLVEAENADDFKKKYEAYLAGEFDTNSEG